MKNYKIDAFILGENIRECRNKKGMTIVELADCIGRTAKHMNMIELGLRNPSLDVLIEIMNVLDVDANKLFGTGEIKPTSIDDKLSKLDKEKCNFLTDTFIHMIERISA